MTNVCDEFRRCFSFVSPRVSSMEPLVSCSFLPPPSPSSRNVEVKIVTELVVEPFPFPV